MIKNRIVLFIFFFFMALISLLHPGPGLSIMALMKDDMWKRKRERGAGATRNP